MTVEHLQRRRRWALSGVCQWRSTQGPPAAAAALGARLTRAGSGPGPRSDPSRNSALCRMSALRHDLVARRLLKMGAKEPPTALVLYVWFPSRAEIHSETPPGTAFPCFLVKPIKIIDFWLRCTPNRFLMNRGLGPPAPAGPGQSPGLPFLHFPGSSPKIDTLAVVISVGQSTSVSPVATATFCAPPARYVITPPPIAPPIFPPHSFAPLAASTA